LAHLLLRLAQVVLSNLPSVDKGKPTGKSKQPDWLSISRFIAFRAH
jgi:hypothetical protein